MSYLDENGVLYLWGKIKAAFASKVVATTSSDGLMSSADKTALGNKVDKVTGKGLSTNDYTTDEKNKLAGIAAKANNYSLPLASSATRGGIKLGSNFKLSNEQLELADTVSVAGLTVTGTANFTTATLMAKTLREGSDNNQVATTEFVNTAIESAIGGISGIDLQVVETLPATGVKGTIYLLSNNGAAPNQYDEYIWVNNGFEKIGSTAVDLSGYWAKNDLKSITNTQIDSMCV